MKESQKSKGKRQKILITTSFLLFTCYFLLVTPTFAQEASPSSDFKTKLKALQEEIASKAANLKLEVSKKLLNKVYLGSIKTLVGPNISLNTNTGLKNIIINEYTEYFNKGQKINLKNISEANFIIALGDSDEKGVLTAKRVIKTSSTSATFTQAVYGEVTTITPNIVINTKQGTKITIKTDKNTSYQFGKNDSDFKKVLVGKPIIALGDLEGQELSARFIYIYPYALLPNQPTSTSSASQSAKPN